MSSIRVKSPLASDRLRLSAFIAVGGTLVALLILLSIATKNDRLLSQDQTVLTWFVAWDLPGLTGISEVVSFLTDNWPGMALALLGILFLWLVGLTREAAAFTMVSGIIGIVAFLGDYTLGELVDRPRPLDDESRSSYPSGHVFGTTVLFGFWGFLAIYYRLKKKPLIVFLAILAIFIATVGIARIHLQAHWPTDVVAGYLLGALWLLILIPLFLRLRKVAWISRGKLEEDLSVVACETCRIEKSIASKVILDPEQGTATKVYSPPPVVRLIYWLAFQARFPYERNPNALHTAEHRRKIASLLTKHRFGKDLVAHVVAMNCNHDRCSFVTEFIPGEKVENTDEARQFLGQVAELFAEAGLAVWQVNPHNPHAHTNIIRNLEGDFIIIDLESAIATPIPARGQWRSALRQGALPIFDDIDFERLRGYVATNEAELISTLGSDGLRELQMEIEGGQQAVRAWQDAEPRIWGRLIRGVYRILDWKSYFQHLMGALQAGSAAAEAFLNNGMARWQEEKKLEPDDETKLRAQISSGEAQAAFPHLGAHLVLSVALALPIPGLRSLARFLWTLTFWFRLQIGRLTGRTKSQKYPNIHTPVVMVLALVPALGGVAYLAARPLRKKLLIRLLLDQAASKLPLRLYTRLHLARWLAPASRA